MFFRYLFEDPEYFFWWISIVVFSTCLHELFHAIAASMEGDNTAKELGYFTMNPMTHMGTPSLVMLLLTGLCWGACPVNPAKFKGRYSEAIVSFAGPFANLLLMVLCVIVALGLMLLGNTLFEDHVTQNLLRFLEMASVTNAALFLLNMLPIPPLDGSKVWGAFIPAIASLEHKIGQGGFALIMLLFCLPIGFGGAFWDMARNMSSQCFILFTGLFIGH